MDEEEWRLLAERIRREHAEDALAHMNARRVAAEAQTAWVRREMRWNLACVAVGGSGALLGVVSLMRGPWEWATYTVFAIGLLVGVAFLRACWRFSRYRRLIGGP